MMISDERIAHMHGVAEYMYEHAGEYGLPADDMYLLGLLHDIGYLYGSDNHEVNGERLLRKNGFLLKYSIAVGNHAKYISDSIHPIKERVLLIEADMHIGPDGEYMSFRDRLNDIKKRYGKNSEQYKICSDNIAWLEEYKSVFLNNWDR